MTDDQGTRRYTRIDAYDVPAVAAVAAGTDSIVLADGEGRVDCISTEGREHVVSRDALTDLAVADRVYVLADETLEAFGDDGSRAWHTDLPGSRAVTADPTTDQLFVRMDDGTFLSIEGETGTETGRFDQPNADVAERPQVAAFGGRLAVASWSFLTVLTETGELVSERTLSGAVTGVGLLPDRAVASLKDGRLVGHGDDGAAWQVDSEATWLAPTGKTALAVHADGETMAVTADGALSTLSGLTGTPLAVTPDLSLFCTRSNDTVNTHASVGEADGSVAVSIATETLDAANPAVSVELSNEGETVVEVDADVEATGATPRTTHLSAVIEPDGTVQRRLVLDGLTDEAVTLTVDAGDATATAKLPVREQTTELAVETALEAVREGVLSGSIELRNAGESTITGLSVDDTEVGDLAPNQSRRVPFERDLPVGETPIVADDIDPVTADTAVETVPTDIELATDGRGFLTVTLSNDTPVEMTDVVTLTGVPSPDGELSLDVTIPSRGVHRTLVPVTEAGERVVSVETAGGRVSERLDFAQSTSLLGADTSPEPDGPRERAPASDSTSEDGLDGASAGGDGQDALSLVRRFPTDEYERGATVPEQLVVRNETDQSVEATLTVDEDDYRGQLEFGPKTAKSGRRRHVSYDRTLSVPPVTLVCEQETVSAAGEELSLTEGPFVPLLTWQPNKFSEGGTVTLVVEATDAAWTLTEVRLGDELTEPLDVTVEPGEPTRTVISTSYELDTDLTSARVRARPATASESADRGSETVNTLLAKESLVGDVGPQANELSFEIGENSRVSDGLGVLFVVVENEGSAPVDGVALSASGSTVERSMYAEGDAPGATLNPEETLEYIVDLEGIAPNQDLTVDLALETAESGSKTAVARARTDADGEVQPEDWSIEVEESPVAYPPRLSTPYE